MTNKATKIKSRHESLQTQVSACPREDETYWPTGVVIEQGTEDWYEDAILLESEGHARQVVGAIRKCAAELGWEVE
jgi:hypothetical protein